MKIIASIVMVLSLSILAALFLDPGMQRLHFGYKALQVKEDLCVGGYLYWESVANGKRQPQCSPYRKTSFGGSRSDEVHPAQKFLLPELGHLCQTSDTALRARDGRLQCRYIYE